MGTQLRVTLRGEDLGIFDPDDVTMDQAMQLEDKTGLALGDVRVGLGRLSARSLQALVYLQRIRQGKLDAVLHDNFKVGDIGVINVAEEPEAGPADPTPAVEAPAAETTPSEPVATATSAS